MRFFKILFIQKTRLEHEGKQLCLITHFTYRTLNQAYLYTAHVGGNYKVVVVPKTGSAFV